MLDGKFGVSGPQSDLSASRLAQREAWVEIQGAIYEGNSWIDVWLEVAEDVSRVAEDLGVVAGSLKRPASKIDAVLTVSLRIVARAVCIKHCVTLGSQR